MPKFYIATTFYKNIMLLMLPIFLFSTCKNSEGIRLKKGMIITKSVVISPDIYTISSEDSTDQPIITIKGDNIVVDFNGATLQGFKKNSQKTPDEFYGLGIRVEGGQNITIKNLTVKGFKWGLLAMDVDSLKIENADFSFNYRQKLKSKREAENIADWLYFHHNENDEWLRYGAAIYLKRCNNAQVKNLTVHEGMNGLMLVECHHGLFYNNNISFNSGIGIGMYRSSHNLMMHNKLDWNIRGYSHGVYQRGQDSAGFLVYENCHKNSFAYNSATHSGDGFFLWAGQTFMESGEGGCNDNLVFGNDFSYAPANGVEITFSRNRIYNNSMVECRYGIWGGYSFDTEIMGNIIQNCEYGIAFEHGQNNTIRHNDFSQTNIGVKLWEREQQPDGWGFTKIRNVESENYAIDHNVFSEVATPLHISNSENIKIVLNQFKDFETLLQEDAPNGTIFQKENKINPPQIEFPNSTAATAAYAPPPLPDGQNAMLPGSHLKGQQYILVNEWGPYSFRYPVIWLREVHDNQYVFALLGPYGNWKLLNAEGIDRISKKTGTFPATLTVDKSEGDTPIKIEMEFIGEEVISQFGEVYKKGAGVPFEWTAEKW